MILVKNLKKQYDKRVILDDINLSLPDKGLVVLYGASGSGKTTLLNCIGGIDNEIDGEIIVNNVKISDLCKEKVCKYRINHIGYIFQNFNLLNLETVYENIKLPLDSVAILDNKFKKRRVLDVVKFLGLKNVKKTKVNKLSGGEKQRVAIGRAIVNSPDIILCDEPTGSLDDKNSEIIYKILSQISNEKLVVVATHDLDAKQYADFVINLYDGKIEKLEQNIKIKNKNKLSLIGGKFKRKNPALSLSFKLRHSINKIQSKKWRSLITNGILSLSLSGIGISFLVSTSLMNKISETFSSLFNGNQIVMSLSQENQNAINAAYSGPKEKALEILEEYKSDIEGIGVTYMVNFEDFFKDENCFYIPVNGYKHIIQSLSCRSINDYQWINDDYSNLTYPYKPSKLYDDELVLGLSYVDMVNICFQLQIQRSFSALGEYIRKQPIQLCLEVANSSWKYDDEQIFNVCAVTESNNSCFYHYSQLWNETVFEKMMMLPSDDDTESYYPWEMYKLYYFKTREDPGLFMNKTLYDEKLFDYVFERTNYQYHPNLCKIGQVCKEKRVLFYYVDKYAINVSLLCKIKELEPKLNNYYFVSDYGYASYASSLMSGFAKNTFISTSLSKNEEAIDADSYTETDQEIEIQLPSNVAQGNFLNSLQGGAKFTSRFDELISGRKPNNLNEIVISKGLAEKIGVNQNVREVYLSCVRGENYLSNGKIEKDYGTVKLIVCGITNNEKQFIYHEPDWTISFFRDLIGISMFLLTPKSVIFELDSNVNTEQICEKFNKIFKEYKFTNPITEISKSSQQTLSFANAILIAFSVVSSLISIILLATTVMINICESKEEIKTFQYIGITDREIESTFVVQSLVHGMIAFAFSTIEIIFVDLIINKMMSNQFMVNLSFSLNPLPILIIFGFATLLTALTSFITIKFIKLK